MNKNKEASEQIKTQIEGIAERITRDVLGEAVLTLLDSDGHTYSKRPCTTCQTVSELVGQPFGCVKKAMNQPPEFRANFLWPYEAGSIENAGYEFINGRTEAYRKQWWDILITRAGEANGKRNADTKKQ